MGLKGEVCWADCFINCTSIQTELLLVLLTLGWYFCQKGTTGDAGQRGQEGHVGRPGQSGQSGLPGGRGQPGDSGPAGPPGPEGRPVCVLTLLSNVYFILMFYLIMTNIM